MNSLAQGPGMVRWKVPNLASRKTYGQSWQVDHIAMMTSHWLAARGEAPMRTSRTKVCIRDANKCDGIKQIAPRGQQVDVV